VEKVIAEYLSGIELGVVQTHKNLSVVPLFNNLDGGPLYHTLKNALEREALVITELSSGGSVPELKVVNKGDIPVLLLDGEELAGAKQNRVLNTTILIDAHSEAVIPVSCTEQGRWSYTSNHFADSDVVMASRVRRKKAQSVSENLKHDRPFRSDQGVVWDGIHEMAAEARVNSPTSAMRDVFQSREEELGGCLHTIECCPGQKGIIVFINGVAVGLDCISLESAYSALHAKLVKSYAMEALLEKKSKNAVPASTETAKAFLTEALKCAGRKYKSVGLGWDFRFEAEQLVGSALECDDHVIHAAFFPFSSSERIDPMAGYRRRRTYRTQNNGGTI
jgi:hypothetical protein